VWGCRGRVSPRRGERERGGPDVGRSPTAREEPGVHAWSTIIDVPSREKALQGAAKIAAPAACTRGPRVAPDPAVGN